MRASDKRKKVIVVGAGPGGLTAAMMLAHKGYEVTVYEKQPYIGGRNSSFSLGDYTFDLGPTFLLMKNVLEDVFSFTGRKLDDYLKLSKLDPMYRLTFNSEKSFFPSTNRQKMKEELERVFPGNVKGYERYLEKEKKKYDKLFPCLAMPYDTVFDFFKWQFVTSLPQLHAHISLYDQLGKYFEDEDLRISFTFQAKYIGMSPWEAPGTFSIISFIEHGEGVFHVEGGLNQISVQMGKVVEEEGGRVLLDTGVRRLIIEDRVAKGVELENGDKAYADHVIINADFAHAMNHLIEPGLLRKYTPQKLDKMKYSCSAYMVYLGIDKIFDEHPHHNIIFAQDYRTNVDEISRTMTLPQDPSFYVQNASVTDPTLAPEGKSTIYVLVPIANNQSGIDWKKESPAFRDKVIDLLDSRAGFSGIRDHIEEERIITPQDWQDEKFVYRGAVFNLGHNMSQMLIFRPHNRFEEFKNCYLVGGGTHPGSGLPTIYESGRISSQIILNRDGVN